MTKENAWAHYIRSYKGFGLYCQMLAAMFGAETTSSYLSYQVHSGCYIENSLEESKGGRRAAYERADGDSEQGGSSGGSEKILNFGRAIHQCCLVAKSRPTLCKPHGL